jgi:hypothetical protein
MTLLLSWYVADIIEDTSFDTWPGVRMFPRTGDWSFEYAFLESVGFGGNTTIPLGTIEPCEGFGFFVPVDEDVLFLSTVRLPELVTLAIHRT